MENNTIEKFDRINKLNKIAAELAPKVKDWENSEEGKAIIAAQKKKEQQIKESKEQPDGWAKELMSVDVNKLYSVHKHTGLDVPYDQIDWYISYLKQQREIKDTISSVIDKLEYQRHIYEWLMQVLDERLEAKADDFDLVQEIRYEMDEKNRLKYYIFNKKFEREFQKDRLEQDLPSIKPTEQ